MSGKCLNHQGKTHTDLTERQIARFATKAEAVKFAKSAKWRAQDATRAANRFFYYWVIAQCTGPDKIRYLGKDGGFIDEEWPGYCPCP